MTEWRHWARNLADELSRSGDLVTQPWRDAIAAVPRHEFVPYYYTQNADATWSKVDGRIGTGDEWLDNIYSDTTFITAIADVQHDRGVDHLAVSSSTMPGLMARMLESLNVRDGDGVLEIGTGSGYNAALLAHRLGSDNVFSVDVDGELVELARDRLAAVGYTPTLVTRDGEQGLAEYAPYDRIIATCAVPTIPRTWIEQTKQGGLILADFKPSALAGNLVLLKRQGDTAIGRFLSSWAGFMDIRHASPTSAPRHPRRDRATARERTTTAPLQPWLETVPWFLAQFGMPKDLIYGGNINMPASGTGYTFISAPDGSWCEVSAEEDNGTRRVVEGGPISLWGRFEEAYDEWRAAGEPDWPRLGLTVDPGEHTVWLDEPDSDHRWSLAP